MDYTKIGKFIETERKAKKLTQEKLADMLFVSEKTISKWENGRGVPDTDSIQKLSNIFNVSINEILNGERIQKENYSVEADKKLLELQRVNEENTKRLLASEIVIGILGVIVLLSFTLFASYIEMSTWLKVLLIVSGFIIAIVSFLFALRIEQVAGFYECSKCHHKYIPTYKQTSFAMHMGRTRYMKCPHCHKYSWNKKVSK